jgi:glycosyltransferase involved in cell wall biosynthesis
MALGTIPADRAPRVVHVAAVEYTARALLSPQLAALQDRGYDVRLICAPDSRDFHADLQQFQPVETRFPRAVRPAGIARALRRFSRLVQDLQPDILHLHTPAVALTVRFLPRSAFPPRTRIVYTVHGFAHVWDGGDLRGAALERVERHQARRTDALLFQSREDLEQVRARGYRTATRYLGNGVQDDWFTGPRDAAPAGGNRGLFVGRLVREKGVLDLLDALERAPEVTLGVAGAQLPTERDGVGAEVALRAGQPPLDGRVELLGALERPLLRREHARADFLVLPSYREGVPRSVIEGMAAGLPALVTDVRGCRELVEHGVNGLVVPPGEPAALARGLEAMASLTAAEYRTMSAAAYQTVSSSYRETTVLDRLVGVYSELGAPPPVPASA